MKLQSSVCLFILLALMTLLSIVYGHPKDFLMEEPCARNGGMCISHDECPHEIEQKNLGLCPKQRDEGAECCNGISTAETRCQRLGGECFESICHNENHVLAKATDCPVNSYCCLLI